MYSEPTKEVTPDEWGAKSIHYPASTGKPGPRDPAYTPWVIPFERSLDDPRYEESCLVTASQNGKTASLLDIVGWVLDTRPVPILWVGPTSKFVVDQIEPRVMELFDQAESLSRKVLRGKAMKKALKRVAGVTVRLAHAGSASEIKSSPAGLAIVDEYDVMENDVYGQVQSRGSTYGEFYRMATVSTPTHGLVETYRDEASGLFYWRKADAQDVPSPIWKLWQSGTMHHWTWACPHCGGRFVPRFDLLRWPANATPAQARRNTYLICPVQDCGGVIEEQHKEEMNRTGIYVAPGQSFDKEGNVVGEPAECRVASFWASGLCSPFETFGARVEKYLAAVETGEGEKIRGAMNEQFGECYVPDVGDLPEWSELTILKQPYRPRTVPAGVRFITMGIDVQKNRLPFVIRGWGVRAESWLIDYGNFTGDTSEEAGARRERVDTAYDTVWDDLAEFIQRDFDGMPIKAVFIDSGFRPGKKFVVPEHRVYAFARRFPRLVWPTKGRDKTSSPTGITLSKTEVQKDGSAKKYGNQPLLILNTDRWKSWVHERIRYPVDSKGAFHLHDEAAEDYFKPLLSEVRTIGKTGKPVWIERSSNNHFLDCEALAAAAAYQNNAHRLGERGDRGRRSAPPAAAVPAEIPAAADRAARIAAKREAWGRR